MSFVEKEVIKNSGYATQKETGAQQSRANAILKSLRERHHLQLDVTVTRKELPLSEFTVHPTRGNQLKTSWGTLDPLNNAEATAFLAHKLDYIRKHPNIQSYDNSCEIREITGRIVSGVAMLGMALFGLSQNNMPSFFLMAGLFTAAVKPEIFSAPFRRSHIYKADEAGARATSPQIMADAITKIEACRTSIYNEAGFPTAKQLALDAGAQAGKFVAGLVNARRKKLHAGMPDEEVTHMYAQTGRSITGKIYETCWLLSGTPSESARLSHLQRIALKNTAKSTQATV